MDTNSKKVIYAALIGNSLVALTKFIAAFMTGSSAMLSEGIHSVVDTGNQVLLLLGLSRAKRPPDEKFPFGAARKSISGPSSLPFSYSQSVPVSLSTRVSST